MLGELRWHVLVCSVNLQVDRAALHFGRNSQRQVQFLFPKRMFSECTHTIYANSVLCRNGQPQRMQATSRRLLGVSASHQRGTLDMLFVDIPLVMG